MYAGQLMPIHVDEIYRLVVSVYSKVLSPTWASLKGGQGIPLSLLPPFF